MTVLNRDILRILRGLLDPWAEMISVCKVCLCQPAMMTKTQPKIRPKMKINRNRAKINYDDDSITSNILKAVRQDKKDNNHDNKRRHDQRNNVASLMTMITTMMCVMMMVMMSQWR